MRSSMSVWGLGPPRARPPDKFFPGNSDNFAAVPGPFRSDISDGNRVGVMVGVWRRRSCNTARSGGGGGGGRRVVESEK